MSSTREKILTETISCFNSEGTAKVTLQRIADEAGISQGNLTYHYRTKQVLLEAVLDKMVQENAKVRDANMAYVHDTNTVAIIQLYLRFQLDFRFFYRDIFEIIKILPSAKLLYQRQIQSAIDFSLNGIYLSIGKGLMKPEPHEGHYFHFSKNAWAVLNTWLTEREVLGEDHVHLNDAIKAMLEYHYPYLTEKGKELYHRWKEGVNEDMVLL